MNAIEGKNLKEYVNLVSNKPFVSAVFLFGSCSRGKATKDSDIDIAVLTERASSEEELEIMGANNDKFDISIFSRLPLVIQFRIINEGIPLFVRDEKSFIQLRREIIMEYLDFAPFIERFYRRMALDG